MLLILAGALYCHAFAQGTVTDTVEYTSGGLRDPLRSPWEIKEEAPTAPVVEEEIVSLPSFSVQGMAWGAEPAKAIINEQVLGKGDTILDAQVLDIKKDGIHLLYKGKEFIIKPQ